MAIRDNPRACRGSIGIPTKETDKLHGSTKNVRKKKKKKKKRPCDTLFSVRPFSVLRKNQRKINYTKYKKKEKENNKPIKSRIISRTHVPRERVNQREKAAKRENKEN